MMILTTFARSADDQHTVGQAGITYGGWIDLTCSCGGNAGLRRARTEAQARRHAREHLEAVGAEPQDQGRRGGRPEIGPETKTRLRPETLTAIDAIAQRRDTTRATVLREAAEDLVEAHTVYLYETDLTVYLQRGHGPIWGPADGEAGPPAGTTLAEDAAAWIGGDWEPSQGDGWATVDDGGEWEPVAWWTPWDGVQVTVRATMGANAREYLAQTA